MKKTLLVLVLVVAMALVGFAGCGNDEPAAPPAADNPADAPADEPADAPADLPSYDMSVGTMFIDPAAKPDFNATGVALAKFKELVEERSEGRITVTLGWASILGSQDDIFDMLRTDDLELVYGTGSGGHDIRYGVFNMPGLITSYEMADAMMGDENGALFDIYQGICHDNNIEAISGSIGTLRGVFNNKKEIHLPSDLKGLVMRTYNDNTVTTYWNGLCNGQVLPMPELYTALQLGTVDGFEHAPDSCLSNSLEEVSDYYTNINWQWQIMPLFLMNKTLFDSMDPADQALMKECAQEASDLYGSELLGQQEATEQALIDAGCAVYHLTDEERAEWEAYGASLYPQFYEDYGEDLVKEVIAICDEWKANN